MRRAADHSGDRKGSGNLCTFIQGKPVAPNVTKKQGSKVALICLFLGLSTKSPLNAASKAGGRPRLRLVVGGPQKTKDVLKKAVDYITLECSTIWILQLPLFSATTLN